MTPDPLVNIDFEASVLARYHHLASRLYNTPLLVHPDKAAAITRVLDKASRGFDVSSFPRGDALTPSNDRGSNKPYAVTPSNIAIIPVHGTLVHRAAFFDAMSGITSYQRLGNLIQAAAQDNDVRGILLDIDSPGGEASGLFDLADRIKAIGGGKPLWAIANEEAFSAAYAIASAADKLYAPRSALAGSIGVIALHVDQSVKDAKAGLTYTAIYAGERKADFSRHEPLSDQARARIQSVVDDQYGLFVAAVARHRNMEEQQVRGTQAQVYTAPEAQALNLIDGIATLGEVLTLLEAETRGTAGGGLIKLEGQIMTDSKGAPAATNQPDTITLTQTELDEIKRKACADGLKEGLSQGAETERQRIAAILDHEAAATRAKLARHLALHSDMTPESAAAALEAAPMEASLQTGRSAFEQHMDRLGNPTVGADAGSEGADSEEALVQRVLSA